MDYLCLVWFLRWSSSSGPYLRNSVCVYFRIDVWVLKEISKGHGPVVPPPPGNPPLPIFTFLQFQSHPQLHSQIGTTHPHRYHTLLETLLAQVCKHALNRPTDISRLHDEKVIRLSANNGRLFTLFSSRFNKITSRERSGIPRRILQTLKLKSSVKSFQEDVRYRLLHNYYIHI